jgi:hypothetical protein
MPFRRPAVAAALVAVLLSLAAPVRADPFLGAELLTGRSLKAPKDTQVVRFGLDAGCSPMSAALGYVKDRIRDKAIQQACAAGVPDCKAAVDQGLKALKDIPDATWDRLQTYAGMTSAQIDQELLAAGVTDPYVRAQVVDYVDQADARQRVEAVKAARIAARAEKSVNLLMEPWVYVNTKYVEIGASIPFSLRIRGGGTDASLGNVTLDLRSGGSWGSGGMAFGVTGGLAGYFPSGTRTADESARADLFQAPKVLHQYLTLAPYLVAGFDAGGWITLVAHLEYLAGIGVRDHPAHDSTHVLKYGVGTVLLSRIFINILVELNGLVPLKDAAAFEALYVTGGLQFKVSFWRLAIAVEAPVWSGSRPDTTVIGGVPVGRLSTFNVLARTSFTF